MPNSENGPHTIIPPYFFTDQSKCSHANWSLTALFFLEMKGFLAGLLSCKLFCLSLHLIVLTETLKCEYLILKSSAVLFESLLDSFATLVLFSTQYHDLNLIVTQLNFV